MIISGNRHIARLSQTSDSPVAHIPITVLSRSILAVLIICQVDLDANDIRPKMLTGQSRL